MTELGKKDSTLHLAATLHRRLKTKLPLMFGGIIPDLFHFSTPTDIMFDRVASPVSINSHIPVARLVIFQDAPGGGHKTLQV